jgi:hypothetical protein
VTLNTLVFYMIDIVNEVIIRADFLVVQTNFVVKDLVTFMRQPQMDVVSPLIFAFSLVFEISIARSSAH